MEPIRSSLVFSWDPVFGQSGAAIWRGRGIFRISPDGGVTESGTNQGPGGAGTVQSGLRSCVGGAASGPRSDSGRGRGPAGIQSGVVWIGGAGPAPAQWGCSMLRGDLVAANQEGLRSWWEPIRSESGIRSRANQE